MSKQFVGRFPSNYFDVICAWELLEHINNPKEYIKEINRILKPGGKFIASMPNASSITFRILKDDWEEIMPPNHIYFFSKKFLRYVFAKHHFKNIKISCASKTELCPPLGIYALTAKIFGLPMPKGLVDESVTFRKRGSLSPFKRVIYFLYYKISSIVSAPINLFGHGDSLLLVATKYRKI